MEEREGELLDGVVLNQRWRSRYRGSNMATQRYSNQRLAAEIVEVLEPLIRGERMGWSRVVIDLSINVGGMGISFLRWGINNDMIIWRGHVLAEKAKGLTVVGSTKVGCGSGSGMNGPGLRWTRFYRIMSCRAKTMGAQVYGPLYLSLIFLNLACFVGRVVSCRVFSASVHAFVLFSCPCWAGFFRARPNWPTTIFTYYYSAKTRQRLASEVRARVEYEQFDKTSILSDHLFSVSYCINPFV